MLDYLYMARWDQAIHFLNSGSPPVYLRLLALNAVCLALYALRRASGADPMSASMSLIVQMIVLGANLLILFQTEVTAYLALMGRR